MLSSKLLSSIGNTDKPYVDDVFSAYTYTGNGSTQTINNGIDLAGKGGMVWTKSRTFADNHWLANTLRGGEKGLFSNTAWAEVASGGAISFLPNGYSVGSTNGYVNANAQNFVSWTFRKAPKFFDVVTYTGDGVAGRQIPHGLGIAPGMIIVKRTNASSIWYVQHRSILASQALQLNTVDFVNTDTGFGGAYGGILNFTVSDNLNASGSTYVAYLFAHDTSADGIVQCGSYVGNGSATGPVINLGWEPQFLLVKNVSAGGSGIIDWVMLDTARGITTGSADSFLRANIAEAENTGNDFLRVTPTGFQLDGPNINNNPQTYIYLAIRRPNKPPTFGTQVYNATTSNTNSLVNVGFPADLFVHCDRGTSNPPCVKTWINRLCGSKSHDSASAAVENNSPTSWDRQNSLVQGFASLPSEVSHFFRRAPGFFDVVCYTGDGVGGSGRTITHGLGVAPELVIVKNRSAVADWRVWTTSFGSSSNAILNNYSQPTPDLYLWANPFLAVTNPITQFGVYGDGTSRSTNTSGQNYVAYLFASLPGISKVDIYTGNGSSQTINCGFTTGARFILIKRTDSTGDWYVWNSVCGIVAANDPHMSLNGYYPEVTTDDSVDPASTGFIVNQVAATNINVTSSTYLYLAIA